MILGDSAWKLVFASFIRYFHPAGVDFIAISYSWGAIGWLEWPEKLCNDKTTVLGCVKLMSAN